MSPSDRAAASAAQQPDLRDERGIGLVIAILAMLLISVLGISMMLNGTTDLGTADNYLASKAALYQADSGLELAKADFLSDTTWVATLVDGSTLPLSGAATMPATVTVNGSASTPALSGGSWVPAYYPFGGSTVLGNGSFAREIFLPPPAPVPANGKGSKAWLTFRVRSVGTAGQNELARQTVQADLRVQVFRVAIWDNAIFAGKGQSGDQINGDVEVRGSVHVVGDPNDPTLLDWSGNSRLVNHYGGIGANQSLGIDAAKLPSLPTRTVQGEVVETLDTELRLKHGTVRLSGNADLGEPDSPGDGHKEVLDGVFTDTPVQFGSGAASVHADETGAYDIDIDIPFPDLDAPHVDGATGQSYAHHRDFLNVAAMTVPLNAIDNGVPAFSLSDAAGNAISWDPATSTLTVDGMIRVDGDMTFGRQGGGGSRRIEYRGTGTIYATDDIEILWDLVPAGDYLDLAAPVVDNLGLIADDDVSIGTSAQLTVMAAVYAEDQLLLDRQSAVAGATVANYFDMGNQVPSVYQVPRLASNLPPGMPGADPFLVPSGADLANWTQVRR